MDYYDFKISVKSSSVPTMIRAYRMLSERVPYPLHLGVTEAGPISTGSIKSAIGVGSLLMDGIGDTIRISLTADPVEEVKVAWEILKALGLRERGPVMIACPSCGRDNVGVWNLAEAVEERLKSYPQAFEVAVMGCAVNGPGEAGDADFGIAGGRDTGFIYAHGRVLKKVSSDILVDELFHEIDTWIAGGMERPKRLKLAKPAALLMAEAAQRPLIAPEALMPSGLPALHPDPPGGSGRCRSGEPQAARPRRLHPPGLGGPLVVHTARLARPPEDRADHPRGDGRDRRPGDADARPHSRRALGDNGPPGDSGDLPCEGSDRSRLHPAADPRRDGHVPRARAPELPRSAAALVPLPDEGSRRAASARRTPAGPRVHHEGRLLVRPRRGGRARELRGEPRRVQEDLRPLRAGDVRRPGGERDHGRQVQHRLPGAVRLG